MMEEIMQIMQLMENIQVIINLQIQYVMSVLMLDKEEEF
jgi:hypothetical protein